MPTRSGTGFATASAAPQPAASQAETYVSAAGVHTANIDGLSAYELQRLENIRRNQAMLVALGLSSDASDAQMQHNLKFLAPYRHMNAAEPP